MIMFPYDFFDLDKFLSIPKIFHNFISFYRILSYWNHVNKRVVDEFFEVLDLENIISVDNFNKFRLLIHIICVNCY